MLIRSQDRRSIINLNEIARIAIIEVEGKYRVYPTNAYGNIIDNLGEYSTEEKAIKVLDIIQNTYSDYTIVIGGGQTTYQPSVFQMPKDSEVKT